MAMTSLICPHCGGNFELEPDRDLQPFWVCPYCGNRSLMQKNDETIRLRGIIPSKLPESITKHRTLEEIIAEAEGNVVATKEANSPKYQRTIEEESEPEMEPEPWPQTEPEPDIKHAPEDDLEQISEEEPELAMPLPVLDEPPEQPPEPPVIKPMATGPDLNSLCELAREAALSHNLPLFNSYSRRAIDCQPEDPRIYTLRAILTEDADGFARATWTTLFWNHLTPRRKKETLAQHLYNFNAALKYSQPEQQQELIQRIARGIVRQAADHFTEQAELRCRQNLIFKTFKGRYHRSDFQSARYFADTLHLIEQSVCPLGHDQLLIAVRNEIEQLPQRVARHLKRV